MATPAIGIDLGSSYCSVSVLKDGRQEITRSIPSVVAFPPYNKNLSETNLYGDEAKSQVSKNPNRVISVGTILNHDSDIKLEVESHMLEDPYIRGPPEDFISLVIRNLKKISEAQHGPIKDAVISVPDNLNTRQRRTVIKAGVKAGLNARIINASSAAALAYGQEKKLSVDQDSNILIFDLGGRFLKVTVLCIKSDQIKALITESTQLGGEDFDDRIFSKIYSQSDTARQEKIGACEKAKISLSTSEVAIMEGGVKASITRDSFEEICSDLFLKTLEPVKRALSNAKMDKSSINDIILVGGSSKIPKIQKLLKDFFPGKLLTMDINPDEAVARGAAVRADILTREKNEALSGLQLSEIAYSSLYMETEGGVLTSLVKKNTTIPTTRTFTGVCNMPASVSLDWPESHLILKENQPTLPINIYEGEEEKCGKHFFIGEIFLPITPAPSGKFQYEVMVDFDTCGLLNAYASQKLSMNHFEESRPESIKWPAEEREVIREKQEELERDQMDQNKESLENYIFMLKNISGQVTDPAKKQTIRDKCEEVTNLESQITQMLKEKRNEVEAVCNPIVSEISRAKKRKKMG